MLHVERDTSDVLSGIQIEDLGLYLGVCDDLVIMVEMGYSISFSLIRDGLEFVQMVD